MARRANEAVHLPTGSSPFVRPPTSSSAAGCAQGTDQRRLLVELELDETLFTPSSAPRARWSQGAVGTMGAGVPLQHQSAATGSVASSSSQRGRPHHTMGVQPTVSSSPYRLKQRVLSSRKSTTAEPLHRSASTRCFSAKHNSHQQQQQQRLRSLQLVVDAIHHNIQQREQLVDQVQQELAARRVAVAQDRSAPALSAPLVKLLNKLRSVSLSIVEMVVFFNQEKARFSHAAIDVQEDHFVLATEFEDYLLKLTHCDVDFMALYAPLAALFDRAGVSLMRNPFLDGVSLDSSELLLCSCHRASDNTGGATSSLTQLLVHRLEAFGLNMRKLMPAWQVLPAQRVATALLQLFETESRRNAARMLPSFLQPHDVSFYATNLSAGLHDRQQPPLGADGAQPPLSCQSWTATETIREDPDDDIKFIKMPTLDTQSIQAPKAAEVAVATVTVPPLDISMVVSPAVEVEAPQPKSKPSSVHTNTSESKGSGREKQNKPKSQPTSSRAQDGSPLVQEPPKQLDVELVAVPKETEAIPTSSREGGTKTTPRSASARSRHDQLDSATPRSHHQTYSCEPTPLDDNDDDATETDVRSQAKGTPRFSVGSNRDEDDLFETKHRAWSPRAENKSSSQPSTSRSEVSAKSPLSRQSSARHSHSEQQSMQHSSRSQDERNDQLSISSRLSSAQYEASSERASTSTRQPSRWTSVDSDTDESETMQISAPSSLKGRKPHDSARSTDRGSEHDERHTTRSHQRSDSSTRTSSHASSSARPSSARDHRSARSSDRNSSVDTPPTGSRSARSDSRTSVSSRPSSAHGHQLSRNSDRISSGDSAPTSSHGSRSDSRTVLSSRPSSAHSRDDRRYNDIDHRWDLSESSPISHASFASRPSSACTYNERSTAASDRQSHDQCCTSVGPPSTDTWRMCPDDQVSTASSPCRTAGMDWNQRMAPGSRPPTWRGSDDDDDYCETPTDLRLQLSRTDSEHYESRPCSSRQATSHDEASGLPSCYSQQAEAGSVQPSPSESSIREDRWPVDAQMPTHGSWQYGTPMAGWTSTNPFNRNPVAMGQEIIPQPGWVALSPERPSRVHPGYAQGANITDMFFPASTIERSGHQDGPLHLQPLNSPLRAPTPLWMSDAVSEPAYELPTLLPLRSSMSTPGVRTPLFSPHSGRSLNADTQCRTSDSVWVFPEPVPVSPQHQGAKEAGDIPLNCDEATSRVHPSPVNHHEQVLPVALGTVDEHTVSLLLARIAQLEATVMEPKTASALDQTREDEHDEVADTYDHAVPALNWTKSGGEDVLDADADTHEEEDEVFHYSSVRALASIASALDILPTVTLEGGISTRRSDDREEISMATPTELPAASSVGLVNTIEGPNQATPRMTEESTVASVSAEILAVASAPVSTEQLSVVALSPPTQQESETDEDRDSLARIMALCRDVQVAAFDLSQFLGKTFTSGPEDAVVEPVMAPPVAAPPPSQSETNTNSREVGPIPVGKQFLQRELKLLRRYVRPWRAYVVTLAAAKTLVRQRSAARSISRCYLAYREHQRALELQRQLEQRQAAATRLQHQWSHYQARVRQCADQNEFHCQHRTFKRWVLFVRVRHRRARREMAQQQISACWRQHQANQAAAREAADKLAREREQRRYAAQRVRSFLQERHLRHKLAVAREMTKQILFKQQLHATKIRREQEKNKMLEAKRLRELEARYRRALSAMEQQFQSADEERRVLALRQQHLLELKHKQDTKRRREMAAQRIQAFMRVTTLQHKLHVVEQAKHRLATQQQKAVALRQREDIQRERKQAQLRLERRVLARRLAKAERATVELRVQHEQLAQTAQVRDASAQRALAFERIQAFVYQIAQARRSQQVQVTLLQRQAELEQQQAAQEAAARRVLAQERIHAFVHKHLAERRLAVAQEAAKKLLIKQNLLVRRQRQQATKAAALMDKRQREKSRSLIGVWITEQVKAARARKEAERQRQALEEHVAGETARRRVLEAENAALRVREAQAEQRLMVQTNLRALQRRKSQMKEQQHAEKRRREAAGQRIQAFVVHHTERHGAAVAQRKLEQRKIEEQQAAIAMERRVLDCFVRAIVDSKLVAETVALNGVVAALGRVREIIHTAERRKQQLLQQQQADAATQIQTQWRGHSARELVHEQKRQLLLERQRQHQRERVASLTRRSSARKIQRQWRREQRRQQRRQQETEAATAIETRWRGHKARQQHEVRKQQRQQQQRTHAATDIQRQWKGHAAREQYTRVQQQHQHQRQRQHHAATHIQAQWRGAQGRQRVEQLREERRAFRAKQAALAERVAARKMSDHTCERWARRQIQQQQQCDPVDEDGKEESQMVAEASVSVEQRQQWASVVIQRMVRAHQRRRALQFRVEQSDGHCCEVWFARGRAWLSWSVAPLLRARYDVQLTRRLLAMLEVSALGLNNELQQALAVLAQDTQPLLLTGMSQSLDVEVDVAEMELPAFCQLTRQIGRIKSMHKRAEVAKSSSSTPSSPVSSRPASPKNKLAPPAEPAPGATGGLSIWEAIESASVEDLQFLRARGVDLAQRDPATQRTALHALTFCREPFRFKLEMLSFLLGPLAQLDVDARDQHGDTPLALYAAHGHLGLVDKLLAHGADLASVNAKGQTALHRACEADQVEVVAFLQARCRAAGDHALAQRLHALDRDGRSPLHVAAEKGFVECARQLLDVQDELTQMLLWQWDPQGRTALHVAVQHSQLDVATLLLACAGGSALANGYDHLRRYPLHLAVEAHQATQLIQLLVANGADVNATDERGDTALHWAAFAGREAVVQTLLALEADVTMLNSDWETAAQIAAAYDHMSCITLLVQAQRHGVAATPVETGPDDGAERRRVKKDQSKTKGEYWAELHQEVQLVEESGRFSSEDEGGVGDGSDSD